MQARRIFAALALGLRNVIHRTEVPWLSYATQPIDDRTPTIPIIAVGSASVLKLRAVDSVCASLFPLAQWDIRPHSCDSGVPETPWDLQTLTGAVNRAREARRVSTDALFAVGLESGLVERFGEVYEEAWACVLGPDGSHSRGYSSGLRVPDVVMKTIRDENISHIEVMRGMDGDPETGRDTWALYTQGQVSRLTALCESLRNALAVSSADGVSAPISGAQ